MLYKHELFHEFYYWCINKDLIKHRVSEHAVQATAFGPDVLEANMVPIICGLASKNLNQLTSYAPMSLALTSSVHMA